MVNRNKIAAIVALAASIIIALQILLILIRGSGVCFNDACAIVEAYTTISPLGLNLIGFLFFQALFWPLWRHDTRRTAGHSWPNLLLLAGLAAETVLFSFQLYVVRSFCAYCLLIFGAILVLNLLRGRRQVLAGATLCLAIVIGFSVLSFRPALVSSETFTLAQGTYGMRTCAQPTKKIYLIFSENCPHCLKVVDALNNCNSCELHLNPIDEIKTLQFAGVDLQAAYSPQINRMVLSMFGIQEIPVLLVDHQGDFSFIKGETKIIDFITHACFTQSPTLYLNRRQPDPQEPITAFLGDDGKCAVDINCDDAQNDLTQP